MGSNKVTRKEQGTGGIGISPADHDAIVGPRSPPVGGRGGAGRGRGWSVVGRKEKGAAAWRKAKGGKGRGEGRARRG
jgi:hypothetical protein